MGDGYSNAEDCDGYGTHVAGTISGKGFGVAKNVSIRAGRVVNCGGYGTTAMVLDGMEWIYANGSRPAVVNMSLGSGRRAVGPRHGGAAHLPPLHRGGGGGERQLRRHPAGRLPAGPR